MSTPRRASERTVWPAEQVKRRLAHLSYNISPHCNKFMPCSPAMQDPTATAHGAEETARYGVATRANHPIFDFSSPSSVTVSDSAASTSSPSPLKYPLGSVSNGHTKKSR